MLEKADRFNEGKPKWSILDYTALIPLVRVMEYGTIKYSRDNWKKGLNKQETLDSLMRHLVKIMEGEEYDQESHIHHIGHIMANCMFYSHFFVDPKKVIEEEKNE